MACHIPLKSSRQGLKIIFKPHLNRRFAHNFTSPQSCRSPNFGNLGTPTWDSRDKMTFGCWPRGQAQSILYGGRWWLPPSSGHGESCESVFTHGSSMHQKCSNWALTNLLFGLCRSIWIIDLLVNLPRPHPGAPACPSTPEVLWIKECASIPFPSVAFIFGLTVESIKELRCASSMNFKVNNKPYTFNFSKIKYANYG